MDITLTPEEDAIGDPDEDNDDIDDTIPADLWFRGTQSVESRVLQAEVARVPPLRV